MGVIAPLIISSYWGLEHAHAWRSEIDGRLKKWLERILTNSTATGRIRFPIFQNPGLRKRGILSRF